MLLFVQYVHVNTDSGQVRIRTKMKIQYQTNMKHNNLLFLKDVKRRSKHLHWSQGAAFVSCVFRCLTAHGISQSFLIFKGWKWSGCEYRCLHICSFI